MLYLSNIKMKYTACLPPGSRGRMTEDIGKGTGVLSPGDLNSNNNGETTASYAASYVSNTSSQNDADFIQDNSEYQWFLDYGYREGIQHQVSVLSSLSESYARGLLSSGVDGKSCGLYDDLARNLDANLAEVDMENFCAEDIHSLLNTLPTMCDLQKGAENNTQGEMFASISALSNSMMGKFDFDSSLSPHSSSQGEDSAGSGSIDTMSICKSELLFSPVKESAVPGTINFSVDSLDSDIMLTCQANKDNYTIAFEGSTTMGSEDSEEYHDHGDSESTSTDSNNWSRTSRMMNPALAAVLGAEQRLLNSSLTSSGCKSSKNGCGRPNCKQVIISSHNSMARSDSTFTTWSKLKKPDSENPLEQQQLSRHPSGNNNTTQGTEEETQQDNNSDQTAVKSRSLPNLARQQQRQQQQQQRKRPHVRGSLALSTSSSIESSCVKLYDVRCNGSPLTSSGASSCSGSRPAGSINLVRLFMKQRNGSGTDHSTSVSDGWDSDSCVRSATGPMRRNNNEWQSSGGISQSCRGKQVSRSCQGVETTRNDNSVDECQCLPEESITKPGNKLSLRSTDSPRRTNCSWVRGEEMTDCSTCTFEDSLYRLDDEVHRTHEQITEEDAEGPSEHSESVEQVSESISKIHSMARDSTMENVHSCDDSSNYSSHHGHVHGLNKTEGNLFQCQRFNLNNNNSLEREDMSVEGRRQLHRGSLGNCCCCGCENKDCRKHASSQGQLPLINKSMQTSCMLDVLSKATLQEVKISSNKDSSPAAVSNQPNIQDKMEKEDEKIEKGTKPVYVYYPNYALPDLGFLKEKKPNLDLTKVYLRPQKFSAATSSGNDLISKIPACLRKPKKSWKQQRPFSCSDVENLRKKGFDHVQDWDSLTVLLPKEYRVLLADVPEVLKHVDAKNLREQELQPLFCVSPPMKNRHSGCECTNFSSASSTNTQPSSGYRGSSTLLTDSSTQSPNYNPLYVYRYDSVSSEASLMGTEKKKPAASSHAPPLPKRSISLPGGKDSKRNSGDVSPLTPAPPRPPLPKGILRTGMEGDVVSNSKMRKEAANKRFSMFEMGAGASSIAANKRCSLQEPYYLPGQGDRKNRRPEDAPGEDDEGLVAESSEEVHSRKHHHHLCSHAEFEDVLRLSDYIHMSTAGLSDASESEWDDDKMARLKRQVSRFLSSESFEQSSQQTSKTVSFGTSGKLRPSSSAGEMKTPPNSPNVSALLGNHRQYQCKLQQPLTDLPIREEDPGESSADEHYSAPPQHNKPNLESKKALVTAVSDAVEEVICHFSGASTPGECARLGDSALSPAVANSVIGTLCPALYAVLSDGLLPNIATAFGDISNSVWQVVEASAQQGHMTRSLNELVLRLNSEDVFSEGLLKFNAFVCGLLNVRSVDAWMGYLRTRESILRKHYSSEALLVLSLRGGPTFRALTDSLLAALRPLSLLPFHLDLLFECRQLHQSLQRLGAAAATSPTSLLRLVRSIQNSVGQLTIAEEYSSMFKGETTSADKPLPDLLEQSTNSAPLTTQLKRNSRARQLRRPRSCIDSSGDGDPSSSLRKRWSGVQLGSKLSQALDRLLAEDTEEDFSDSLNATPATPATPRLQTQSDQSTSEDATLVSHCSDMDHTDTDLSDRSAAAAKAKRAHALGVGGKFKRLQMKWEKLSGSGTESRDQSTRPSPESSPTKAARPKASFGGSSRTSPAMSPVKSSSRSSLHSPGSTTSSTSSMSRIPRLVTSPVRPSSGIPLPRGATSPTQAQIPIRRPSLPPSQGKRTPATVTRTSRVDQSPHVELRSPATRPSSLPYHPVSPGHSEVGKKSSQRRANSASVSRPGPSARKARPVSRYVRTIKHQLASDSGHLSFSTGERLSLVLEVDEQWLLCCRGDRKGLVRRSAVVAVQDHSSRF